MIMSLSGRMYTSESHQLERESMQSDAQKCIRLWSIGGMHSHAALNPIYALEEGLPG